MKYENYEEVKILCNGIDKCEKDLELYQNIKSNRGYYSVDLVINEDNGFGTGGRKAKTIHLDDEFLDTLADEQIEKLKAEIEEYKAKIETL